MLKYAKIIDETTGLVAIGEGNNEAHYTKYEFQKMDVKQSDIDNRWYLSDLCPMMTDVQIKQKERDNTNQLSLTAADVERAIYKAKGIDFEDVIELVKDNPNIDLKALKIELKANNFYRGNLYINLVGTLLGFTMEQLDNFFKTNDYNELLK